MSGKESPSNEHVVEQGEEVELEQKTETPLPAAATSSRADLPPTRVTNPFRRHQSHAESPPRENFPAFERSILDRSTSSSNTSSPDPLNRSNASYASSLNMSIGAKAALNAHLRHVAKHGLSPNNSNSNSSNNSPLHGGASSSSENEENQDRKPKASTTATPPRNPLDQVWDQLLEEHAKRSPESTSSSKSTPGLTQIDTMIETVSTDDGVEAIEVSPKAASRSDTLYDTFYDDTQSRSSKSTASYFNSSRVDQLRTPERNKREGPSFVTLRHEMHPTSPSILEEPSLLADPSGFEDDIPMAHMFHALTVGTSPHQDSSFASFAAGADLSRISGNGDSPENSFQRQFLPHQPFLASWDDDEEDDNGPMLDVPPPPPPPRHEGDYPIQQSRHDMDRLHSVSWTDLTARHHHNPLIRSMSPPKRRPLLQKQHSCPETWHPPLDWGLNRPQPGGLMLSAAAQKAALLALQKPSDQPPPTGTLMDYFQGYHHHSEQSGSSQGSPPQLFPTSGIIHTGTHETSVDDLSTIQNESSSGAQNNTSSSSSSMKRIAIPASATKPQSSQGFPTTPSTAAIQSLNKSTLSSSSSSSHAPLLDRRRYRTVVPSRVFLKEAPKEGFFPVARDSFSDDPPAVASAESQEEASLLQDSFEAAYQVSLSEEVAESHYEEQQQQQSEKQPARKQHSKTRGEC